MKTPLVTAKWLNDNLNNPDFIILDSSTKSNASGIKTDYENVRIKGARHFNLKNNFSDKSSSLPNMLPSSSQFEIESRKLGVNKSSTIVVYDNLGIYTSPRVWWMFKTMGHQNVFVLDGGLPDWVKQGYGLEPIRDEVYELGDFSANFSSENVKDYTFIKSNIKAAEVLVIDARSSNRFKGIAPEPRADLKSGSIPQSINIPFPEVLNAGKYKSVEELKEVFKDVSQETREISFSCGSGLTACIILLACELVNENKKSIYDGSWTEWAELENLKV